MTTAARIALLAVLLLAASPALADDPQGDPPVDPDVKKKKADLVLRMRIHRAIDKGAAWLATQQEKNGAFRLEGNPKGGGIWPGARHEFGETTLSLLTLAHCDYTADHRAVKRALGYLRKRWKSQLKGDYHPQASTYSLCLFVLGLYELFAKPGSASEKEANGRYGGAARKNDNPCGYPKWAKLIIKQILDWLLKHQSEKGLFRYPDGLPQAPPPGAPVAPGFTGAGPHFAGPEDLSNSQYVLLALWVGSRCGYEVKTDNLRRIARRLIEWQESDGPKVKRTEDPKPTPKKGAGTRYAPPGDPEKTTKTDRARGFGYTPGDRPTGSMTAAGLGALVTVKAMLQERDALESDLRKALDAGIWDGIAWLTHNYTVKENHPVGDAWHYYYLYGLERALVIAGKQMLGEHDWYKEGARLLVDAQKKTGAWKPPGLFAGMPPMPGGPTHDQSLIDSCFALLFLKRAAVKPKKPVLDDPVTTPSMRGPPNAGGRRDPDKKGSRR